MAATATNPPLCDICPKPAKYHCPNCRNVSYCSPECWNSDQVRHNTICSSIQNLELRPSEKHFRCLLFPVDETQPRFIWMHHHHHGDRPDDLIVNRDEVKTHVAGSPSDGDMQFDCHRELKRQFAYRLCVWHNNNMQGNKHARNACLHALLGDETADWQPDRWKGSFLVCAYKYGVEEFARDRAFKLYIPVHLDTGALGPILSFMQWRSRRFDQYGLDTPRKRVIASGVPQISQTPNGL
jgi:hypothetical protein